MKCFKFLGTLLFSTILLMPYMFVNAANFETEYIEVSTSLNKDVNLSGLKFSSIKVFKVDDCIRINYDLNNTISKDVTYKEKYNYYDIDKKLIGTKEEGSIITTPANLKGTSGGANIYPEDLSEGYTLNDIKYVSIYYTTDLGDYNNGTTTNNIYLYIGSGIVIGSVILIILKSKKKAV